MFKRRKKSNLLRKIQGFFWPSSGWKRSTQYLFHRIGRLPGTPYSIAAGFACGAAISFTPFVGLHIIMGCLIACIVRANIIATVIGTAVGNPWTFPFIWTFIFNLGVWLSGVGSSANANELNFQKLFSISLEAIYKADMPFFFVTAWPVLWPMFIGGVPTFFIVWIVFYFSLIPVIKSYQWKRQKRVTFETDASKK